MLCLSKYTPNRITYILADETLFIVDLMTPHNLVPTLQSTRFLEDRRQKSRNVDQGLLCTHAEFKKLIALNLCLCVCMCVCARALRPRFAADRGERTTICMCYV